MSGGAWGARVFVMTLASAVAAIILLLGHQPLGRLSLLPVLLLAAAFAGPIFLGSQVPRCPASLLELKCEAPWYYHPAIFLALLITPLVTALAIAMWGFVRARRA
jgi:hypothetical protein